MLAPPLINDTGEQVVASRYALRDLLGVGGMGVVYRASDLEYGREVAIKFLHSHHADNALARFRLGREGSVCRDVAHPNVVAVLDAGTSPEGTPFVVMECVRGQPLGTLLQAEGPLSLRRTTAIMRQLLAGLGALHRAGIVHGEPQARGCADRTVVAADAERAPDVALTLP